MRQDKGIFRPALAVYGLFLFLFILTGCGLDRSAKATPTLIMSDELGMPDTGQGPQLMVIDQQITGQIVSIARVISDEAGWIVLYADENGAPGAILAYAPVSIGSNQDVQIELIEPPANERIVHALLHIDAGEPGSFEWPGADRPVEKDGEVVQATFRVSPSTLSAGDQSPTAPAAGVTPTPGEQPLPPGSNAVDLQLVAEGFTAPVGLVTPHSSSGLLDAMSLFVVDQIGLVWIIDGQGGRSTEPFLDLRDRLVALEPNYDERGLLSLAFSPTYSQDGRFFVYYSAPLQADAPPGWDHTARISEFRVSAQLRGLADPHSERILLQVDQPQANNNGGKLAFGPDGHLYIALGDGGGSNDAGAGHVEDWYTGNPGGNAQNITETLLGKILRININSVEPYGIPLDNPFVNQAGLDEIYAYGFRNPFSMVFDGNDNRLYVGDVGQNRWEEINLVEKGGNYGWNIREGKHCFNATDPNTDLDTCPTKTDTSVLLINPILEYPNARRSDGLGLAVIGGYTYRGRELSDLRGSYLFGDWSAKFQSPDGSLFVAYPTRAGGESWDFQEVVIANRAGGRLNEYLLSFGQDNLNELYVLTSAMTGPTGESGKVYRLIAPGRARPLVTPTPTLRPTAGAPAATPTSLPAPTQTAAPTQNPELTPTSAPSVTQTAQPSPTPSPLSSPTLPIQPTSPTDPTPTPTPSPTFSPTP